MEDKNQTQNLSSDKKSDSIANANLPNIDKSSQELSTEDGATKTPTPPPIKEKTSNIMESFSAPGTTEPPKPEASDDLSLEPEPKKAQAKSVIKQGKKMPKVKIPTISKKVVGVLIGIIAIIVVAVLAGYVYTSFFRTIPVVINSNQDTADIIINGKTHSNISTPYTIRLKPGEYEIAIQKDDFFGSKKMITLENLSSQEDILLNLTGKNDVNRIKQEEALYPVYSTNDNSILYFSKNENGYMLKEFDLDTKEEISMLKKPIVEIEKVVWSPGRNQLVVRSTNKNYSEPNLFPFIEEFGDNARINWILTLTRTNLVDVGIKNLHQTIRNVTFSPEGDQIAYFFKNDIERTLAVANNNGDNFTRIAYFETLPFDPDVVWSPDSTKIALFAEGQEGGVADSDIMIYDFTVQNIIRLTENGISKGALFSPDGSKLLYESGGTIWNYNLNQKEDTPYLNLEIPASLDRTVWLNNNSFITVSNVDGILYKVSSNGNKEELNYKQAMMPSRIDNLLIGQSKLFVISPEGMFEINIEDSL